MMVWQAFDPFLPAWKHCVHMQWRSQDFSEGEAIVTTQFYEGPGACPGHFLNLGLWNGISCILRALFSKIYRFEIPFLTV